MFPWFVQQSFSILEPVLHHTGKWTRSDVLSDPMIGGRLVLLSEHSTRI